MSITLRLSDELVKEAETEAYAHKRTTPKQIEYWAAIGKAVVNHASTADLTALIQGFATVQIQTVDAHPIDPKALFAEVEQSRESGELSRSVSQAKICYEASQSKPGLLDQIHADGSRIPGHFYQGQFIAE